VLAQQKWMSGWIYLQVLGVAVGGLLVYVFDRSLKVPVAE